MVGIPPSSSHCSGRLRRGNGGDWFLPSSVLSQLLLLLSDDLGVYHFEFHLLFKRLLLKQSLLDVVCGDS
jgi:hypothetical protein